MPVSDWTDVASGKSPRTIDGLSGMTITTIAVGGSDDSSLFVCLVTDRGILLTHGSGEDGCLGHGDRKSVEKPKVKYPKLPDAFCMAPQPSHFQTSLRSSNLCSARRC